MSGILDMLSGSIGQSEISNMSKSIGASPEQTTAAITAALPMLMGALARNSSKEDGANALAGALDRDHDGSILDNLGGFLSGGNTSMGDGILRHVLGGKRNTMEQGIGQMSGLDAQQVGQLIAMLAPVVMGMIGKQKREQNLDAGGLSSMLQAERAQTEEKASPEMGMLGSLLDRDGDGNVADDIAGLGMDLLGGFLKK